MKKLRNRLNILFLAMFLSISSCDKKSTNYIEIKDDNKNQIHKYFYLKKNDVLIKNGKYVITNSNGVKIHEMNFKFDKLYGTQLHRYEKGNLKIQHYFKNGKKQGREVCYFENGVKSIDRKYLKK